ncbi:MULTISPECIES: hypothetical protein [Nocardia]|uniref:Uncharacterized protein n=1 Tax=Nocardia cyriacigeorgica TaxID=135487 RepID=A0A5R8PD09_9NOCA|nr:hypothetical protein [Nocardia cyriacigeorgica]MBF6424051.1 hypothetical protein [Nocardia cyriacigeorgica]TLF56690.1 hypothetical protein FEK31_15725 [Nocardia cyriacigeorgica]TLG08851.1 hypothetical protein FEK35_16900 [Nocardia cyriacigeorgica]
MTRSTTTGRIGDGTTVGRARIETDTPHTYRWLATPNSEESALRRISGRSPVGLLRKLTLEHRDKIVIYYFI